MWFSVDVKGKRSGVRARLTCEKEGGFRSWLKRQIIQRPYLYAPLNGPHASNHTTPTHNGHALPI